MVVFMFSNHLNLKANGGSLRHLKMDQQMVCQPLHLSELQAPNKHQDNKEATEYKVLCVVLLDISQISVQTNG